MKPVLFNTTILTGGVGNYSLSTLTVDEAKALVADGFDSAIGHQATADALTALLGVEVPANRVAYEQQPGQEAVVLKLRGRLPEGQVLTLDELNAVGYDLFRLVYNG